MKQMIVNGSEFRRGRMDFSYHFYRHHNHRLDHSGSQWSPLSALAELICDGPRNVITAEKGLAYVKLAKLKQGDLIHTGADCIHDVDIQAKFRLQKNDVLLSKTGETVRSALVRENLEGAVTAPDIYRLQLKKNNILPIWVTLFFRTRYASRMVKRILYGATLKRLAIRDLKSIRIPIPPPDIESRIEAMESKAHAASESAQALFSSTIQSLYAEIDARSKTIQGLGKAPEKECVASAKWLRERWDVPYLRNQKLKKSLSTLKLFKPVSQLAQIAVSSRKHLDPDQKVCFVQISDIDPHYYTFTNVHKGYVKNLPYRIRAPLRANQVLMLASGSNLGTASHPIAVVEPELDGCLGSNAFLALEFKETPIYYGLVMRHPLVLAQLRGVSSGAAIAFINKRQIQNLLIPSLGAIWRHDYNDRARIAWERRHSALNLRTKAINVIDDFIMQILKGLTI